MVSEGDLAGNSFDVGYETRKGGREVLRMFGHRWTYIKKSCVKRSGCSELNRFEATNPRSGRKLQQNVFGRMWEVD